MSDTNRGELAQGYLVQGGSGILRPLHAFLADKGIVVSGNADVFEREYPGFTVDDARALRDRAQTRALQQGKRIFIVITPSLTVEAQNALLKTLEEPRGNATFFLVVPSVYALLPTLRSRTQILTLVAEEKVGALDVIEFLDAPFERRLDMLKPLYQHDDDARDIRGAVQFLEELEKRLAMDIESASSRTGLDAVFRARKYLVDKGSLLKVLLEHVALLVPKM